MWSAAIFPAVLAGTSSSVFLDAMQAGTLKSSAFDHEAALRIRWIIDAASAHCRDCTAYATFPRKHQVNKCTKAQVIDL
jgi:hypothetical protein